MKRSFSFLCGAVLLCSTICQELAPNYINPNDSEEALNLKSLLESSRSSTTLKPMSTSTAKAKIGSGGKEDHLEDHEYNFQNDRLPVLSEDEFNSLSHDANPLHFLKQLREPHNAGDLTKTETEPTKSQTEPAKSQTEPTKTLTEPTKTETEPTKTETKPTKSQTEPTKSQTEPAKAEIEATPTKATISQTESIKPQDTNADFAPGSPIYITIPIYINTSGKSPLTLTIGEQELSLHPQRSSATHKKHHSTKSPNSYFNRLLAQIEPPKRRATNRHRSQSRSKIHALKEHNSSALYEKAKN